MKYKEPIAKCACTKYNKLGWYRYLTHLEKPDEDTDYNFEQWTQHGMPIFKVINNNPKCIEIAAECPVCGRGGIGAYKSLYSAIKHWNEMQEHLNKPNCPFMKDDKNTGRIHIGSYCKNPSN